MKELTEVGKWEGQSERVRVGVQQLSPFGLELGQVKLLSSRAQSGACQEHENIMGECHERERSDLSLIRRQCEWPWYARGIKGKTQLHDDGYRV